jgi:cysteine-rich repeat protein
MMMIRSTSVRRLAQFSSLLRRPTLLGGSLAVAFAVAGLTPAQAAVPASIRRHDVASVEGSHIPGADGLTRIKIHGRERSFDLELEPSRVLAAGAETIVIDTRGEHHEPSTNHLYRGHVAGDLASTVRVALTDSSAIGSVSAAGQTWFFEPLRRYEHGARADETIVYNESDIDMTATPGTCAAEEAPLAAMAAPQATTSIVSSAGTSSATTGLLELTLVADYAFFQSHGADSAAYMQSIIDQVANFYPLDISLLVAVVQTVVYQSPGIEPLSSSTAAGTLLSSLAAARAAHPATLGAGDITHLFTGRDLDQNVIGIAYLGTVCDSYYASSVAQDFNSNLHLMTILTGHELGHSLGAYHDGEAGSPCVATGIGYVMWPIVYNSLAEQFSACSEASIQPVVASASCIGSAVPPNCGNGVLDPGEACDDGNNVNGDCCRSDCQFEVAGAACAADANACTNDVCSGLGTCLHPNNTDFCDDGNACSADGQCSGGVCTGSTDFAPMYSPRLKGRLRGGGKDFLYFSGYIGAAMASQPTESGAVVRFLDGSGALLHESVAAAGNWVDRSGIGTSFVFDPLETAAEPPVGGLSSMHVRFKPAASLAKIKLKLSNADLSSLEGQDALGVQILLGDPVSGDCGTTVTLSCVLSDGSFSCS